LVSSYRPPPRQHRRKPPPGAARARVVPTQFLDQLGVDADLAVAAFDLRLARGNPLRRLLVGSKGRLGVVIGVHDSLLGRCRAQEATRHLSAPRPSFPGTAQPPPSRPGPLSPPPAPRADLARFFISAAILHGSSGLGVPCLARSTAPGRPCSFLPAGVGKRLQDRREGEDSCKIPKSAEGNRGPHGGMITIGIRRCS
jgi:hypothetical protein